MIYGLLAEGQAASWDFVDTTTLRRPEEVGPRPDTGLHLPSTPVILRV